MNPAFLARLCCLMALLQSAPAVAAETDQKPHAPSTYVSVAGAPGDGEQALAAALGRRLEALGIKQATAFESDVYDVQGTVRVSPAPGGKETITIIWVVLAPDGNQLGVTRQTKEVKKGSLNKKWGGAAEAAAAAAAAQIVQLLPH
jgi:hypothetical protein